MEYKITLGSKEGRVVVMIVLTIVVSLFVGVMLIVAEVNYIIVSSLIGVLNVFLLRYLYLLFKNKPVIYLKDGYLVVINPFFPNRKINLNEIIKLQNHIISRRRVCLTIKHFKGNTICETILSGNIYNYDLDKLPNLLNKNINKYNQSTRKRYEELNDKSAAIGLLAISSKNMIILAIMSFAIPFIIHILSGYEYLKLGYGYIIFFMGIYFLVSILYFKKIIPNYIFQYINFFFIIYPIFITTLIYAMRFLLGLNV